MGKKVLIVDDIAFVRKTIAHILTEAHYQVVGEAADGQSAVEEFKRLKPDVITMDIVMPNMSGIEATRKILHEDKHARIVMISALEQENLVMEAINAGARDYIYKPFSAADLLKTLDRLFREDHQIIGRPTHR